jgi:hypothetical protein
MLPLLPWVSLSEGNNLSAVYSGVKTWGVAVVRRVFSGKYFPFAKNFRKMKQH